MAVTPTLVRAPQGTWRAERLHLFPGVAVMSGRTLGGLRQHAFILMVLKARALASV